MHQSICQFCSLIYEGLHASAAKPGIEVVDSALLWVWGRSLIAGFSHSHCSWHRRWAAVFHSFGITFASYTRHHLKHPFVHYIKLSFATKHSYCGSTHCSMVGREHSRIRKFRQGGWMTHEEPALTVLRKAGTFFSYAPIVLQMHATKRDAEIAESLFTSTRKCSLNTPWVYRLLPQRNVQATAGTVSPRLVARARRLLRGKACLSYPSNILSCGSENERLWRMLHSLSDKCNATFELVKQLRSHSTSDIQLYLMLRMSNRLEEPKKSQTRHKIKQVLDFKGLRIPPSRPTPIVIGSLSHAAFKSSLCNFVRKLLSEYPNACIPLHIPRVSVVEGRWATLESKVN